MARPRTPDDSGIIDSTAALASLYQRAFAEFIPTRTALVRQLQRSGHKDVAARIASAAKPTRAAWLVNQVYWRQRAAYDDVLEQGTAARAAQQARLLGDAGADMAARLAARDAAVSEALDAALQLARDEGTAVSDALRAQVRGSFDALAAHGQEARLPHGHLTADVPLPGLGAFAGLSLAPTEPGPVRRFEVVARRADPEPVSSAPPPPPDPHLVAAEALVQQLEQRHSESIDRLTELQRGHEAMTSVLATAEAALAAATRELTQAAHEAERAQVALDAVTAEVARLAEERAAADRALSALRSASRTGRPARRLRRPPD